MKVPFGLHKDTNRYIGIDEAENGLRCGCICPSCKMQLKARQGEEKEHHFAHHNAAEVECNYSYWVSVRSMAKQMIEERYLSIDIKRLNILSDVPWHKEHIHIKKIISDPKIKDRQLDSKVDVSFGTVYVHLITDVEDRGSIPIHRNSQIRNNTFSEYLIYEINIQDVKKCDNKTSKKYLEEILKRNGEHKSWFSTHSSCLDYLREKKRKEKYQEKIKRILVPKPYQKPKSTYGDSVREITSQEYKLKNTMINFLNDMHRSYSQKDKLSIPLHIIYTWKNLWYVSCCNEFFCISYQWEYIIYEVIGNEIIRLESSTTFEGLEFVIKTLINERNNAF